MESCDLSKTYVIATRGSKLALWQSQHIQSRLAQCGLKTRLEIIVTMGDKITDRFLHEVGGKGLFVKELEESMRAGTADLAVHSTKDLPAKIADEFCLIAILKRHSPFDLVIFNPETIERYPELSATREVTREEVENWPELKVGTSSLRRQALLRGTKVLLSPLRGNIDTRIAKLHEGSFDAIVLAEAGIDRLAIPGLIARRLSAAWFVPSPAQGALSIECLASSPIAPLLRKLNDLKTEKATAIERRILEDLGGDCTMPIGCYASDSDQCIAVHAKILAHDGQVAEALVNPKGSWQDVDPAAISREVIAKLHSDGLSEVLSKLKGY